MKSFHSKLALGLLILQVAPPASAAESLGRLFLSPEQRSALDQQARTEGPNGEPQGNAIRFDGKVLRSNNRNTYWISGKPANSAERIPAELRIGETVDPSSGEKRPLLEDGALRIHKPPRQ